MGAWGMKTFECDSAFEWYDDFCLGNQSVQDLKSAFNSVLLSSDYLEVDECVAVLVAGAVDDLLERILK